MRRGHGRQARRSSQLAMGLMSLLAGCQPVYHDDLLRREIVPNSGTAQPRAAVEPTRTTESASAKQETPQPRDLHFDMLLMSVLSGGATGFFGYLGTEINGEMLKRTMTSLEPIERLPQNRQQPSFTSIGVALTGGVLAATSLPLLLIGLREPMLRLFAQPGSTVKQPPPKR